MNAQIFTGSAQLSRLLVALLMLPVFLAVVVLYTVVILGMWVMDGIE